jgi:hypothetical protein
MREMGQDFVIELMEEAVSTVGFARRDEFLAKLKGKLGDEAIAKAVTRILDPNFDQLRLWRWISGVAMARQDLDDLGQTQDLTQTEAARLADIIVMFGRLLKELRGQTVVLILDEMERLTSIGTETVTTFVTGFTRLVDPNQNVVSVLIGASATLQSELVEVFSFGGPVVSRLGKEALIEIPTLPDPEVSDFIKDVIVYLRDPEFDIPDSIAKANSSTLESFQPDFFPFSEEAIESLKSHLTQMMTPREITINMTRALGRAHRGNKSVITSDCIK